MGTNKCIEQKSEMNVGDCFGCKSILSCLEKNPSAEKLTRDEKDELLSSIEKVPTAL